MIIMYIILLILAFILFGITIDDTDNIDKNDFDEQGFSEVNIWQEKRIMKIMTSKRIVGGGT